MGSQPLRTLVVAGLGFWAGHTWAQHSSSQDASIRKAKSKLKQLEKELPDASESGAKLEDFAKDKSAELIYQAKELYAELKDEQLPALWKAIQDYLKTQKAEAERSARGGAKEPTEF